MCISWHSGNAGSIMFKLGLPENAGSIMFKLGLPEKWVDVALIRGTVWEALEQKKTGLPLATAVVLIAGIIYGLSVFLMSRHLLLENIEWFLDDLIYLGMLIFYGLLTVIIIRVILGVIYWSTSRLYRERPPLVMMIKVVGYAFMPGWILIPIYIYLQLGGHLFTPVFFMLLPLIILLVFWLLRSLTRIVQAMLNVPFKRAAFITASSFGLITFIMAAVV